MIKMKSLTIMSLSALALAIQGGALQAATFNIGGVQGQFDSSMSIGATWSTAAPDKDLIGQGNGGNGVAMVGDDGRLNFRKGDLVSNIFKGVHDLELKWGNSGFFLRGNYWYDFELRDGSREVYDISDRGRLKAAKTAGAQILDAFFYHNYTLGGLSGTGRVGKQVISWGESTFIPNSLNAINPVNLSALRRPGAEIKEALIPVNMLYGSQMLTDTVTLEAFYQLEWSEVVIDNCGTFFSGTDLMAKGCERAVVAGSDFADINGIAGGNQVYLPRVSDRNPRDSGQFGVSLKWYAEHLNSTEFGLYAMNYHSRGPNLTAISVSTPFAPTPAGPVDGAFMVDYAEDIRLYGISFQNQLPTGTSLGGEISYRPNMPMQINGNDLVGATLIPDNPVNPLYLSGYAPIDVYDQELRGYVRKPFTQAQMTAMHMFPRVLGASRLMVIGEVGVSHIDRLGSRDGSDLRFGRDTVFGNGPLTDGSCGGNSKCTTDGFYTSTSWGYRVRGNLEYSNAFMGVALTPSLAISHDVSGYGPTFTEGNKAVSIGLGASYKNTYSASIDYTNFFGGDFNTTSDRDFLAVSFGINF